MKDKLGILTSITCLIHCLLFPILGTIFPLFIELEEPVEVTLIIIAFMLGTFSFIENVIKHKFYKSLILFVLGFSCIITGVYLGEVWNFIGLIILIISHYLNYKNIKNVDGCHPHGCKH
jgi:riboflavin transporter FmnP